MAKKLALRASDVRSRVGGLPVHTHGDVRKSLYFEAGVATLCLWGQIANAVSVQLALGPLSDEVDRAPAWRRWQPGVRCGSCARAP